MLRLLLKPEFQQAALIVIPDNCFFQTVMYDDIFEMWSGSNRIATFPLDYFSNATIFERLPEAILMAMELGHVNFIVSDKGFEETYAKLYAQWKGHSTK